MEVCIMFTTNGNIYKVKEAGASSTDSLTFTAFDHGVTYVQGMAFFGNILYVSGNINSETPKTSGKIARGVLQGNSNRNWSIVAQTEPYETADYFDHLFSGFTVIPTGDTLLVCSGARGDHGEVQTRYGIYPGIRNKAITSIILQIPAASQNLVIPDDSVSLNSMGLVYAKGIRNTFDMAYNGAGELFGAENSGDRDADEELNWLRKGRHYGFPWIMGNQSNPQQFSNFDPANDIMINHSSKCWTLGFFNNDPDFPKPPQGMQFSLPCANIGPDADYYRDNITGDIIDASSKGEVIYSFTSHRSPLGLIFDNDSVFGSDLTGDGFITGFTCGDTTMTAPSALLSPFNDTGEDLLHLTFIKDNVNDNYKFISERVVTGFSHPVDAEISGKNIYLIEVGFGGEASLYKISFPITTSVENNESFFSTSVYPNPAIDKLILKIKGEDFEDGKFLLFDVTGKQMKQIEISSDHQANQSFSIDLTELKPGLYTYSLHFKNKRSVNGKVSVIN